MNELAAPAPQPRPGPKYGPPVPVHLPIPVTAEHLAELHTLEDLADMYWTARALPGETMLDPTGGVRHGPRSEIIWQAMSMDNPPPRVIAEPAPDDIEPGTYAVRLENGLERDGMDYRDARELADVTGGTVVEYQRRHALNHVRVVPASSNGYTAGWLAQYRDADTCAWFDLGDPLPTEDAARARARAVAEGQPW